MELFDDIILEQWNAELNVEESLQHLDEKESLMSEYIQEGVPSSLTELNKHKSDVDKNKTISRQAEIRKIIRTHVTGNNLVIHHMNVHYKDGDKAVLYKEAFNLLKSLCEKIVSPDKFNRDYYRARKQFFDLVGVKNHDKRVIRFKEFHNHFETCIDVSWANAELHPYIVKPNTRFFHFSNNPNVTTLNPYHQSESGRFSRLFVYAKPRVYLFAVNEDNYNGNGKNRVTWASSTYGKYMYEYIPKPGDRFYIDKAENSFGKATPVFINTLKPLHVTSITKEELDNFSKSIGDGSPDKRFKSKYVKKPPISDKQKLINEIDKKYNDIKSQIQKELLMYDKRIKNGYDVSDLKDLDEDFDFYVKRVNTLKSKITKTYPDNEIVSQRLARFDALIEKINVQRKLFKKRIQSRT